MKWKQIVTAILRILWMLRVMTPPPDKNLPPSKRDKDEETDDKPPAKSRMNLRSECEAIAADHVGATYSSNFSRLLPRSQVLSLLQWDSRRSARKISLLVLHCSDTRPDQDFSIESLASSHRNRGFGQYPGYHIYIRRDGTIYYCRPVSMKGCHVKSFNAQSIGICYEGGHSNSPEIKYEDNRTAEQMVVLDEVFKILHAIYPDARIVGHNELNPHKACPCLTPPTSVEYKYILET